MIFDIVAPQSKQTCTSDVVIAAAVAIGATIFIECLIGAPIIYCCITTLQEEKVITINLETSVHNIVLRMIFLQKFNREEYL